MSMDKFVIFPTSLLFYKLVVLAYITHAQFTTCFPVLPIDSTTSQLVISAP